jgi:phosphate-selective porin OprO/OprP
LSDRPELRVDPTQILSTGAALGTAANPLTNAQVYGGGGIASWRNFQVNGEAYLINVNRQGLATNSFEGGYIEGSWILTGEQRKYSPPAGAYLRPVPEHPFLPFDGSCCGAFELAARYSTVDLNENFTPRPPPGSNSVGGGQQTVYAVGLNWYPNANMRFLFDYLHGKVDKRVSTAAGGGITGTPPAPRWAASSMPSSCARRSRSEPAGRRGRQNAAPRFGLVSGGELFHRNFPRVVAPVTEM